MQGKRASVLIGACGTPFFSGMFCYPIGSSSWCLTLGVITSSNLLHARPEQWGNGGRSSYVCIYKPLLALKSIDRH